MAIFQGIYKFVKSCQNDVTVTHLMNGIGLSRSSKISCLRNSSQFRRRYSQISGNNLATALRPFYFAVHPDRFGQHPNERGVNENSLKQLIAFLESAQKNHPTKPTPLKFYLRPLIERKDTSKLEYNLLKVVDVTLAGKDVKSCIRQLLKSCDLPTSYVDNLENSKGTENLEEIKFRWKSSNFETVDADLENNLSRDKTLPTFSAWLKKNASVANSKLNATQPIRDETEKLKEILCEQLEAQAISWDCGWDVSHFKGSLQCLAVLLRHHPDVEKNLKGRRIVFGKVTGVSLEGHIILSSSDVRHSWLDLIKRVNEGDDVRRKIPAVELTVSRVLRDIQVVHRKFQPVVTAQNYEIQLRTLSASLADFWVRHGYPSTWPESLSNFQIVVEAESSPLMLSPTGQFLVPSSCPSFLIIDFITQNLSEAANRLAVYSQNKKTEEELHYQCVTEFGLAHLRKDDNVTPERMIECCQRLLQHRDLISEHLKGARIYVTHYFSVLQEGEICLPWNCSM